MNNQKTKMQDLYTILFNTGVYSDITIKIGDDYWKLHKHILSKNSRYFKSLFNIDPNIMEYDLNLPQLNQAIVLNLIKRCYGFIESMNFTDLYLEYRICFDYLSIDAVPYKPDLNIYTVCVDGEIYYSLFEYEGLCRGELSIILNSKFGIPGFIKKVDAKYSSLIFHFGYGLEPLTVYMRTESFMVYELYEYAYQVTCLPK